MAEITGKISPKGMFTGTAPSVEVMGAIVEAIISTPNIASPEEQETRKQLQSKQACAAAVLRARGRIR
ncbi:hypothetical protein FACS1894186_2290 [Alphaproteobacteria bacterium]|nr:hypothetical protein FACS1894186_2290 [Alphaproteobacteria bacterium]